MKKLESIGVGIGIGIGIEIGAGNQAETETETETAASGPPIASCAAMKLLMTVDARNHDLWNYVVELTRELSALEVDVTLGVTGQRLSAYQRNRLQTFHGPEVVECDSELPSRLSEWLVALERRLKPDLVHLNNDFWAASLPLKAPKLLVAHCHDISNCDVARALRSADLIVVPTAALLRELQETYGPGLAPARIIRGARVLPMVYPMRKLKIVVASGLAAAEVARTLDWRVCEADELSNPELSGELAQAAICACSRTRDPSGLCVLEAAATGCALVLSDLPSFRENWDEAAVFVPANDAQAIREALIALMQDERQREELGAKARARAATFNVSRMARAYLREYEILAAFGGWPQAIAL